jgi:hypothetical protein
MKEITIAKDFSRHPAGRYVTDGKYSGQKFREAFLEPQVINHERTIIYFDGARGYGSSFLEEAFGGLARKFDKDIVLAIFEFKSHDINLIKRIKTYIRDAKEYKHGRRAAG